MGEFFKTKKFKIIIAIVAVMFGMMLYSASTEGFSNLPKNVLSMITTPFQKVGSSIAEGTGSFFDQFLNASNNAKQNEQLQSEIDKLNKKIVDYAKLKDENEQLREVLRMNELNSGFESMTASVISRDPADRYGSFIIDKGSLHGVSVNDPVITSSGLVGIVSEVSQINARVQTLLSPEIDVSAFEIRSKELGVITGEIKFSQKGQCKLSILSEETKLKRGDIIVTAGSTGKFPKDIPIGIVDEIYTEAHGFTMYAVINPYADIEKEVTVQVVTDFLGQGSEFLDFIGK